MSATKPTLLEQLTAIEEKGGDGSLDFGRGKKLKVSNVDKVFFPKEKYTKGDVMPHKNYLRTEIKE